MYPIFLSRATSATRMEAPLVDIGKETPFDVASTHDSGWMSRVGET